MTDAGPSSTPAHSRTRERAPRPGWLTGVLVVGALVVGVLAGRSSRSQRAEVAQPDQPKVTVSASPAPTVTVSAAAPSAVTVTASAEPVSPVTITVSQSLPAILTETVATPDCLRALDLADQGFGVAQNGFAAAKELVAAMADAIAAVRRGNFGAAADAATELSAGTEALSTVTGELNGLVGPYDAAREACVNR